jgi:hypothetical protein
VSLLKVFKTAFSNNFNINLPTTDALYTYDRYIKSLEERIKKLEEANVKK